MKCIIRSHVQRIPVDDTLTAFPVLNLMSLPGLEDKLKKKKNTGCFSHQRTIREPGTLQSLQLTVTQIASRNLSQRVVIKINGAHKFASAERVVFNEILWGSQLSSPRSGRERRGGEGGSGVDGRRGDVGENDIRYISMGKQRQHAY